MEDKERRALKGERLELQEERGALLGQYREQVKLLLTLVNNLGSTASPLLKPDWLNGELDRLRRIHGMVEQMRAIDQRITELTRQIG